MQLQGCPFADPLSSSTVYNILSPNGEKVAYKLYREYIYNLYATFLPIGDPKQLTTDKTINQTQFKIVYKHRIKNN